MPNGTPFTPTPQQSAAVIAALGMANHAKIIQAIKRRASASMQVNGTNIITIHYDITNFMNSLVALGIIEDHIVAPVNSRHIIEVAFKPYTSIHFVLVSIVIHEPDNYEPMSNDLARSLGY